MPPQRHVEHLRAAADAEHRQTPPQRAGQQRELPGIAIAGRLVGGRVRVVAVGAGSTSLPPVMISPSSPSSTRLGDVGVDRLRRQQRRDAAGQRDPLDVDAGQEAGVHIPDPGLRLLQIGGQADHGPSRPG